MLMLTCSAYGGEEKYIHDFGGETLKKRGHFGDPGVDGRIILRWIFRKWNVRVWTGWWRTCVNAVLNLRVS
jgi:hypothetical protein